MTSDQDRFAKMERRLEALEQRFADVLAALRAALEGGNGDKVKAQATRMTQAVTLRHLPMGDGKLDGHVGDGALDGHDGGA